MSEFYGTIDAGQLVVSLLPRAQLPQKLNTTHPRLDVPWTADLRKWRDEWLINVGYYPVTFTGEGNAYPDPAACTYADEAITGALITQALPRHITPREFKHERLTPTERTRIYEAAKLNVDIQSFIDDLNMAPYVDLDLQDNIDSVKALEDASLLDYAGRAAEILG